MKILYLGPEGTYTARAAHFYCDNCLAGGEKFELISCRNIGNLARRVEKKREVVGVIPIENSLEGSVNETLNLLAHEIDVKIKAELNLPITHNLIGKAKQKLYNIDRVISHPQALAQCRQTLQKIIPGEIKTESASSTAEAVESIKNLSDNTAALGTKKAAGLHDLRIIKENVQDREDNWTRFIVIGHSDSSEKKGNKKTSLISVPVENRPGILHEILEEFAVRDINLTKIESRPTRRELGEYLFFIDLSGSRQKDDIKAAIQGVEKKSSYLRVLGSYPTHYVQV